jgi:hypothetical protein
MLRMQKGKPRTSMHLQSKYAGNLAKIKTLKQRMDACDKISPFIILDLVDPYLLSIEDYWVLNNWGMLTLSQCKNWQ